MGLETILYLYLAFLVVVHAHELGHRPKRIKWKRFLGIFPYSAAAMQSKSRTGGLIVNVILFVTIFAFQSDSILFQYVGLLAWIHFIAYAIFGSILPEMHSSQVNIKTYIFDDVDNKLWWVFIPLAIISYLLFKSYYIPILTKVIGW
tara:strand:- start:3222 stop:3662 length:441 start_codon:yes stop_codon:yes gene_type:complete